VQKRTCYICHEKGHLSSLCTSGNSSNPIIIEDVYSLCKDKVGNVFAKVYHNYDRGWMDKVVYGLDQSLDPSTPVVAWWPARCDAVGSLVVAGGPDRFLRFR
jgi:hypothetical protein